MRTDKESSAPQAAVSALVPVTLFHAGFLYGAALGLAFSTVWNPVPYVSGPGITATVLFAAATVLIAVAVVQAWKAERRVNNDAGRVK